MQIRKRLLRLCPKLQLVTLRRKRRYSALICFVLTVTVLVGSFSLISSALLFRQSTGTSTSSEQQTQLSPLSESKPQFDVDVVYAYIGKANTSAHSHSNGIPMYPKSLYPSIVIFNFTHVSDAKTEIADVKIEVYLVQISSDRGPVENYTYFEGTNCDPSFSNLDAVTLLSSHIGDLIDSSTVSGNGGGFGFNWTTNESFLGDRIGSYGSYTSEPSKLGLWSAGEPNTITICMRRIGWITSKDTSISTNSAIAEDIVQVQLEKFGEGFLYNRLVPEETLLQLDLFYPPISYFRR